MSIPQDKNLPPIQNDTLPLNMGEPYPLNPLPLSKGKGRGLLMKGLTPLQTTPLWEGDFAPQEIP